LAAVVPKEIAPETGVRQQATTTKRPFDVALAHARSSSRKDRTTRFAASERTVCGPSHVNV